MLWFSWTGRRVVANKKNSPKEAQAQRLRIARHATYEAEAIARHLNASLPIRHPEYQHLRALVVRLFDLNSVVMSVLDDDDCRCIAEMQGVLDGC